MSSTHSLGQPSAFARRPLRWLARALPIAIAVACTDTIVGPPPVAPPVSADLSKGGGVVISQIYGGGGNSGATFNRDFIELYNAGPVDVNLSGWSVQYTSAAGNSWSSNKTNLSGTIKPGHYFLIQEASGGATGAALPANDLAAPGTINMSATTGKVLLANTTTALTGNCPTSNASVIDFVGYGTSADCSESDGTAKAAPAPSASSSIARKGGGEQDTNDNLADFAVTTPFTARNSSNTNSSFVGPLDHVTITGGASSVFEGGTTTFTALGKDASENTVSSATITWASSDATIADVDNSGKVTGKTASDAAVTLTATATAGGITKTATTSITVKLAPTAVPLVISQVYGGGGNSGATLTNDFIELYNPTNATVDLTGWSVQYASASGSFTASNKTDLSGSIAPGHYFLIEEAKGSGGSVALPTPDFPGGTVAMGATNGKVALVRTTSLLGSGCPLADPTVADFVGYGTADCSEGGHPTPALSNVNSATRSDARLDSDDNAADFVVGSAAPRNSSSYLAPITTPIVKIAPANSTTNAAVGTTVAFTATATRFKSAVSITSAAWSSSNTGVATIDPSTGVATITGVGSTTISVTATTAVGDGTATTSFTVSGPPVTVTVSPNSWSLKQGSTKALSASAVDAAGNATTTTFTWSSSNETIATVDAAGVVTGKALGDVTITATSANGIPGTAAITVITASNVTVSGDATIPLGMQAQYRYGGTDAAGNTVTGVTWSTSNSAIMTVDGDGIVSAKGVGTATLKATSNTDGTSFGTKSITIILSPAGSGARLGHNLEFGTPTDNDASDDILIRRDQYTVSYNPRIGGANWVSWNMDQTHLGGSGRCSGTCYSADTALTNHKPDPITAYTTADWVSGGEYDRGHMTPSGDWTLSDADNNTTFFLTNFLPQRHDMNAGPWERLENALRDSVAGGREAYIIAGGIFQTPTGLGSLSGKGKIFIPNSTWKVAIITPHETGLNADGTLPANTTVIAVNMPNVTGIIGDGWEKYRTTVEEIQQATGYDLLALLRDDVECKVEVRDCAPTARITAGAASAVEGASVTFDGSTSSDPDAGDVLSYNWSINGQPAGSSPSFTFAAPDNGIFTVELTVTDGSGVSSSASTTLTVSNAAPVVTSLTVTQEHGVATIAAEFTDAGANDGDFSWTVDLGTGTTQNGTVAHCCIWWSGTSNPNPGRYSATITVKDKDGAESAPFSIEYVVKDETPPVIAYTVTGTEGLSGWYTSDVTVHWTVTDGESGIISPECTNDVLSTNSAGTTFTCSATSEGGTSTQSVTVKRDASAPVVTPVVTGTLGANGWYTSDVTVSWSASDDVSPVTGSCAANVLASDNAGITYDCSIANEAGLTGTGTVTVKRDATTPTIGYAGNAGTYTVDQTVAITCSASDAMSGLASNTCSNISGSAYSFGVGTTTRSATATDNAGNSAGATTSFMVTVTSTALQALVARFVADQGVANSMIVKLAKGNYDAFVNEVNAQTGKKISASNAALLVSLVNSLPSVAAAQ